MHPHCYLQLRVQDAIERQLRFRSSDLDSNASISPIRTQATGDKVRGQLFNRLVMIKSSQESLFQEREKARYHLRFESYVLVGLALFFVYVLQRCFRIVIRYLSRVFHQERRLEFVSRDTAKIGLCCL